MEGLYTVETQRKDGSVIVPGPSKLFQKGANGVAYSNYVDGLEAARLNRERQIRETRIQKQEQVVKQAVQVKDKGECIEELFVSQIYTCTMDHHMLHYRLYMVEVGKAPEEHRHWCYGHQRR